MPPDDDIVEILQQMYFEERTERDRLLAMIAGYRITQEIYVAARLDIVGLLKDGPRDCTAIAAALGADRFALQRFLRVLTVRNLLAEDERGYYNLTSLGALLQKDSRDSLYDMAIFAGEILYPTAGNLLHTIKSGETAFDHHFGKGFFTYLTDHPSVGRHFNQEMSLDITKHGEAIARCYDFSGIKRLIDVGGGQGGLIIALLNTYPHLKGVLFDQLALVAEAQQNLETAGMASRIEIQAGDFFVSISGPADACLLSWIIHDWDDERALVILQNCRKILGEAGRLLLCEQIREEQTLDSPDTVDADLDMLLLTGGQERTLKAYEKLLALAGFSLTRVYPIYPAGERNEWFLIEGVPTRGA